MGRFAPTDARAGQGWSHRVVGASAGVGVEACTGVEAGVGAGPLWTGARAGCGGIVTPRPRRVVVARRPRWLGMGWERVTEYGPGASHRCRGCCGCGSRGRRGPRERIREGKRRKK